MKTITTTFLVATLFTFALAAAPAKKADKHVGLLQSSWDKLRSFRCEFKQSIESKQIPGEPDVSTGNLYIAKPNELRWESVEEGSTTLLNKTQLVTLKKSLRGTKRNVDIYPRTKASFLPKSLTFLTGQGKFSKLYKIEFIEETDKEVRLKFIPKDSPSETYIAEINKDGYLLARLVTETVDTRVTTQFLNFEKNPKLEPELFEYKASPGDIVQKH